MRRRNGLWPWAGCYRPEGWAPTVEGDSLGLAASLRGPSSHCELSVRMHSHMDGQRVVGAQPPGRCGYGTGWPRVSGIAKTDAETVEAGPGSHDEYADSSVSWPSRECIRAHKASQGHSVAGSLRANGFAPVSARRSKRLAPMPCGQSFCVGPGYVMAPPAPKLPESI